MRLKSFLFSLVAALGLFVLLSPEMEAHAAETTKKPTIKFYDENNQEIFPYTQEEIDNMFQLEPVVKRQNADLLSDWRIYYFGKTSFKYNVWIRSGYEFKDPGILSLDSEKTVGKMEVSSYSGGSRKSRLVIDGGWSGNATLHLTHLPRGKSYSFYLTNESNKTIELTGGEVWYDK